MAALTEFHWIDGDTIESLMGVYDPGIVSKATTRAVNRITTRTQTHISNLVRSKWNIKKKTITNTVKIKKAKSGKPDAALDYIGKRIQMIHFGAKPIKVKSKPYPDGGRRMRTGVAVTIRKGRRLRLKNKPIFISVTKSGKEHVFKRTDRLNEEGKPILDVMAVHSIPEFGSKSCTDTGYQQLYFREIYARIRASNELSTQEVKMLTQVKVALLATGQYKQVELAEDTPQLEERDIIDLLPSAYISHGETDAAPNETSGRTVQTVTDSVDVLLLCETEKSKIRQQETAQTIQGVKGLQFVGAKNERFTPKYSVRHLTFKHSENYIADM